MIDVHIRKNGLGRWVIVFVVRENRRELKLDYSRKENAEEAAALLVTQMLNGPIVDRRPPSDL